MRALSAAHSWLGSARPESSAARSRRAPWQMRSAVRGMLENTPEEAHRGSWFQRRRAQAGSACAFLALAFAAFARGAIAIAFVLSVLLLLLLRRRRRILLDESPRKVECGARDARHHELFGVSLVSCPWVHLCRRSASSARCGLSTATPSTASRRIS